MTAKKRRAYAVHVSGTVIVLQADTAADAKQVATDGLENDLSDAIGAFFIRPGALYAGKVRRAPDFDHLASEPEEEYRETHPDPRR